MQILINIILCSITPFFRDQYKNSNFYYTAMAVIKECYEYKIERAWKRTDIKSDKNLLYLVNSIRFFRITIDISPIVDRYFQLLKF